MRATTWQSSITGACGDKTDNPSWVTKSSWWNNIDTRYHKVSPSIT